MLALHAPADPPALRLVEPDDRLTADEFISSLLLMLIASLTCPRPLPTGPRREPSKYRTIRYAKILAAMDASEPRTAKDVAALTGLTFDGQLRADLSVLLRQGKIQRVPGVWGYVTAPEVAS